MAPLCRAPPGPSGAGASTGRTRARGRTLAGMSTHAKRERLLLADLLEAAGPDAPTLCEGWITRDLAAHVVVRERRPDAAGGMLIKQLAARLERVQAEFAEKPYEELIQLIRTGPPRLSPFALKQLDEVSNTVEFYVHAEDVRRAQPDWAPRELDRSSRTPCGRVWSARPADGPQVPGRAWYCAARTARRRWPTAGTPVVTVTGEPWELLLFLFGRQERGRGGAGRRQGGDRQAARGEAGDVGRLTVGRRGARRGAGSARTAGDHRRRSPHTAALRRRPGRCPRRRSAAPTAGC